MKPTIALAALREKAERAKVSAESGEWMGWSNALDIRRFCNETSPDAVLALVEAVEAARRFERASQRYNYRIRDEARSALIEALAPFVFGDEEGK